MTAVALSHLLLQFSGTFYPPQSIVTLCHKWVGWRVHPFYSGLTEAGLQVRNCDASHATNRYVLVLFYVTLLSPQLSHTPYTPVAH
jgi:hypothetical protein